MSQQFLITFILFILFHCTMAHAQTNSVLIRGEITENSPKFYDNLTFTQQIPMKAGEMVVVYTKPSRGMRETYYRFLPTDPKSEQPSKWEDSRGSRWLFPDNEKTVKVVAKPTKGGPTEPFDLYVADDSTLYIAEEEGTLEVQMRSKHPVSLFFLMGKAKIDPPRISIPGILSSTDPKTEKQYAYHQQPLKTNSGKGLLVDLDFDSKKYVISLSVTDPAGVECENNPGVLNSPRVLIASTSDGEYIIKPVCLASPKYMEKMGEVPYTLKVTELPDILELLGIERVPIK